MAVSSWHIRRIARPRLRAASPPYIVWLAQDNVTNQDLFDRGLIRIRELEPIRSEELDAIVMVRIVAG